MICGTKKMQLLLVVCWGIFNIFRTTLSFHYRYKSGTPTTKSKFGSTPSRYILDDVACDGSETSLFDCGYQKKDNCGRNEGAGVICKGILRSKSWIFAFHLWILSGSKRDKRNKKDKKDKNNKKAKIELRGGSSRKEGNVFINGKPVCDDMWDKKDAVVACRMLRYL